MNRGEGAKIKTTKLANQRKFAPAKYSRCTVVARPHADPTLNAVRAQGRGGGGGGGRMRLDRIRLNIPFNARPTCFHKFTLNLRI
jgi:hypothetical protein